MNLQQWALLIVPNLAILAILGVIGLAFRQKRQDQRANEQQRERDFEQHRRLL